MHQSSASSECGSVGRMTRVAECWLAAGDWPVRSYLSVGVYIMMTYLLFVSIILCRTHAAVIVVCVAKWSHAHGHIQLTALLTCLPLQTQLEKKGSVPYRQLIAQQCPHLGFYTTAPFLYSAEQVGCILESCHKIEMEIKCSIFFTLPYI